MRSLELACANGYTYLEAGLSEERMPTLRSIAAEFPLRFLAQGWATTADEAENFLSRAVELNAVAINMHLGHAYLTEFEVLQLIGVVSMRAKDLGIPLLIETHRGRLSQDLLRFSEILKMMPSVAIVLDVSHYLVAGEVPGGGTPGFHAGMKTLFGRTAVIHGRISDGQSVQVSPTDPLACRELTCSIWRDAMRSWLETAPDDAVFLFEPELGPPPYAQRNGMGAELFDRSTESEVLRQLAERAWAEARQSLASSVRCGVEQSEQSKE